MFCLFLIEGVPKFGSIDMMRFCWLGKVCSWWSWRFVSCPHPWNPRPLEESTHVKYCIELACNEERWHVYRRWGDGGCVRCRRCFPKLDDAFFGLAQSCTFWLLHRGLDYLWTGCINANHVRLGWFGWSNNIKSVLVYVHQIICWSRSSMILLVFCFIPTRNHGGCGGCNHKFKGPIQSYNGGVEKMNRGWDCYPLLYITLI